MKTCPTCAPKRARVAGGVPWHWETVGGIRLFTLEAGARRYAVRCPDCHRETAVSSRGVEPGHGLAVHFTAPKSSGGYVIPAACGMMVPRPRRVDAPGDVTCGQCKRTTAWKEAASRASELATEG